MHVREQAAGAGETPTTHRHRPATGHTAVAAVLVDAFLYAGEDDLLELRLLSLAKVVDLFVVVTCTRTHQGQPAPLVGLPSRLPTDNVFPYIVEPSLEKDGHSYSTTQRGGVGSPLYQHVERQHRDGCAAAIREAGITDPRALILISDVDEIPSVHAVGDRLMLLDRMNHWHDWLVCEQRFHSGALDVLHPQQPWLGTCVSRLRDLQPQAMRDARGDLYEHGASIPNAGVHLSWFGTDEERQRKLDTFSHAELTGSFNPAEGRRTLKHANNEPLRKLSVAEVERLEWPKPLRDGSYVPPESWWSSS